MHLPLERNVRRSFNREIWKRRRFLHLAPDVLAPGNRIEDLVPTAARVKDRHVQYQHRVVPTPARAKPSSRFLLIHFFLVHDACFQIADGLRFCMHCDYFLSLGCSRLIANSTSTNSHKINIVIMAPPNPPDSRLSPAAWAQRPAATSGVRVRKVFLARVAAIRRRASTSETEVRARRGTSPCPESFRDRIGLEISCDARLL